jgi:hypothetical protein
MKDVQNTIDKYITEDLTVAAPAGNAGKVSFSTTLKRLDIILGRAIQSNNRPKALEAFEMATTLVREYPMYWKTVLETMKNASASGVAPSGD